MFSRPLFLQLTSLGIVLCTVFSCKLKTRPPLDELQPSASSSPSMPNAGMQIGGLNLTGNEKIIIITDRYIDPKTLARIGETIGKKSLNLTDDAANTSAVALLDIFATVTAAGSAALITHKVQSTPKKAGIETNNALETAPSREEPAAPSMRNREGVFPTRERKVPSQLSQRESPRAVELRQRVKSASASLTQEMKGASTASTSEVPGIAMKSDELVREVKNALIEEQRSSSPKQSSATANSLAAPPQHEVQDPLTQTLNQVEKTLIATPEPTSAITTEEKTKKTTLRSVSIEIRTKIRFLRLLKKRKTITSETPTSTAGLLEQSQHLQKELGEGIEGSTKKLTASTTQGKPIDLEKIETLVSDIENLPTAAETSAVLSRSQELKRADEALGKPPGDRLEWSVSDTSTRLDESISRLEKLEPLPSELQGVHDALTTAKHEMVKSQHEISVSQKLEDVAAAQAAGDPAGITQAEADLRGQTVQSLNDTSVVSVEDFSRPKVTEIATQTPEGESLVVIGSPEGVAQAITSLKPLGILPAIKPLQPSSKKTPLPPILPGKQSVLEQAETVSSGQAIPSTAGPHLQAQAFIDPIKLSAGSIKAADLKEIIKTHFTTNGDDSILKIENIGSSSEIRGALREIATSETDFTIEFKAAYCLISKKK